MKASRRKQTNPNRVAAGSRDLDSVPLPLLANTPTNQEEKVHDKGSEMENCTLQPPLTNGQNSDFELPLDMHVSITKCSYCLETFSNDKELYDHQIEIHGPEVKKPRLQFLSEDFPTEYHRLGRELQDCTDVSLTSEHLNQELSSVAPAADFTSFPREINQSQSSVELPPFEKLENESTYSNHQLPLNMATKLNKDINGEPMNGKTDRIFHMDAYCDLCDREFCNKYFLKTHKANKHGIYEDCSPPASSVPIPFPGMMMSQDPLTSFNFKIDSITPQLSEPLLPWSFKLDSPSQQINKPESTPCSMPMEPPMPIFSMPLPHLESPNPSLTKSNNSTSNGSVNSRSSAFSCSTSASATTILTNITNSIKSGSFTTSAPPANDSSMEDYCHICQKHFCNKYYLRKHKQDVHGIAPDNPPSTSNKRARSGLLDLPMTSTNHMMLPQPLVSLAGMHSLPGMHGLPSLPGMHNLPPGMMVINPYSLPPVAIIPAGSLMPGQQIPPPSHPIISQSMGISPLPEAGLLSLAPPTSLSSTNTNSARHSPSKSSPNIYESGVHCSICSKEFCNDFYLQIHRESKHGMRRGSEDVSREKALSLVKEKRADRLSPLPVSNILKPESFLTQSRSPFDKLSNGEGSILICNFCNKEFTNKYLYRIHHIHDHGLNEFIDPTLMENGELPQRDHAMNNSMNESLMRMAADASAVSYASSFRTSPSNKPQENVVCDICNKQMTNHYSLRLHRFNAHGKDPCINDKYDTKPEISSLISISKPKTPPSSGSLTISSSSQQPLNLTPLLGKPSMLPFLPPKLDFKDMHPFADFSRDFKSFRDMPSFLADRINNELFARSQNQAMHMDLNFFGLPSLGKMPMEDNVKLNFDPEAYCEICKKEFCSKYFLRTHRQNIHGIKSDTTSPSSSKSSDSDKTTIESIQKPNVNTNNERSGDGLDKNSWRWKEPINASRVICDICNKEVCNKYFLRTHKQKKHGTLLKSYSPNVSMNGSPAASDCDTTSSASNQPDEKSFRMEPVNLPQMVPLPSTEGVSEKLHMKLLHFSKDNKEIISVNNNIEQHETCNICNKMFENLNWLKDHIMKDHSDTEALDMSSKNSTPTYTCQVCGIDFPAELSVQLHLIQEHNARVTIETEDPQIPTEEPSLPNSEGNSTRVAELCGRWTLRKKVSNHQRLKKYVCTRCGFDSHWLSSLLDHERNEHGFISDEAPAYFCKKCHRLFPSSNSVSAHMVTVHGFSIEDALHEGKFSEPTLPYSFKCAHCPAVFPTRSWGMAHVRHVHIRSRRDLAIKNSFTKNFFQCSSCSFKTHFAFRLQRHMKVRHVNSFRSFYRTSRSLHASSSFMRPSSSFLKSSDISRLNSTSKEDNCLVSTSAVYKSIAASLLSSSECERAKSSTKSLDTDSPLLQSYKLPLCPGPVDSTSFKMAIQAPASVVSL